VSAPVSFPLGWIEPTSPNHSPRRTPKQNNPGHRFQLCAGVLFRRPRLWSLRAAFHSLSRSMPRCSWTDNDSPPPSSDFGDRCLSSSSVDGLFSDRILVRIDFAVLWSLLFHACIHELRVVLGRLPISHIYFDVFHSVLRFVFG